MSSIVKPGVEVLSEEIGDGPLLERHAFYQFRVRMWLSRGDPVRWSEPWGLTDRSRIEDEGTVLVTDLRIDREFMFAGLFYGVQGMRIGGTRRMRVAPHLAYGERGVPGLIPSNALLTIEIAALSRRFGDA